MPPPTDRSTAPKTTRPFGLWPSLISPRALAAQTRLGDVQFHRDGELIVWLEGRGTQGVLVAQRGVEAPAELYTEQSARGGVGYGGGEFTLHGERYAFASSDGRLFLGELSHGAPRPITPPFGEVASPAFTPDGELIAYVHTHQGVDVIAIVDVDGARWPSKLVEGDDFYMQPAWHPEGTHLAWVSWNQPQMPWDGTRLEIARVTRDTDGITARLEDREVLAGGEEIAVQQPCFSPDGARLAYVSDESGHWHVYVSELAGGAPSQLSSGDVDHATPAWVQGLRHIAWAPDGQSVFALRHERGLSELWRYGLDGASARVEGLEAYTSLSQLSVDGRGQIALLATSSTIAPRVVTLNEGTPRVVRRSGAEMIRPEALSQAEPISWRSLDGATVHGNFYAPASLTHRAQGAPPVILMIHGGPTSQALAGWNSKVQFFTTRGYAVLDVNYRGSTGYGRDYMTALRTKWGVYDMEDAVSAVSHLGTEGLADPDKAVIMGGSAGGYTVLHALVKHPGVFAAGVSSYGIGNLFSLAASTHKFEAAYNDSLLGPLPEAKAIYRERSPIFFIDQLRDPVAIYQGADDAVVPPDQAEEIVASLRARDIPHLYHLYQGEGHGWRKPETIEHFYTSALAFLTEHVVNG